MEQLIKKDLLTGEEFVAKRANQRFARPANRIKFYNRKASILNQERAFFDKPCKKSELALRTLYNRKSDNIFHKEFLRGKGVNFRAYNHIEEINNERIICYYGYALRKVPDSDNYQILKL
ncbi:MAG: hypothetical protein RLZZ323_645 [Bacteroidota bacterium]|jgi:hypothetical protein